MARTIDLDKAIEIIEEKQKELCPVGRYGRNYVYGSDREKYDDWEEIIDALEHLSTLTQPNEPLTLEQLREMDGEPVWCKWLLSEDRSIEQGKWFIVISGDKEGLEIKRPAEYGCHFCKIDDCGKTWLAYRRPPEGEEDT